MSFISKLFGEGKKKLDKETLLDQNVCPNCWGRQEYDDKYVEFVKDQTKSNINQEKIHQKAFVQQFIETHITGIHLKREGEMLQCPNCKRKYKHVSSKAN